MNDPPLSAGQRDLLVQRKTSWTGVAVHDLVPGSVKHGHYFRVAYSHRDPGTGNWEIRWTEADEILRPSGEPIYVFDNSTWDMPAIPATVFPKRWVLSTIGGIAILMGFVLACSALEERAGLLVLVALSGLALFGFVWWASIEKVRGTKVGAGIAAAVVVRGIHMKHVLADQEQEMADRFRDSPMSQALREGTDLYHGQVVDLADLERSGPGWRG